LLLITARLGGWINPCHRVTHAEGMDLNPTLEELMDTSVPLTEATELTGVSERTMRRWIAEGRLPAYRVVGQLRIRISDLDRLVERVIPSRAS
jgi:excisionase family DNA binding protein